MLRRLMWCSRCYHSGLRRRGMSSLCQYENSNRTLSDCEHLGLFPSPIHSPLQRRNLRAIHPMLHPNTPLVAHKNNLYQWRVASLL